VDEGYSIMELAASGDEGATHVRYARDWLARNPRR
jgi:hypothetical protein